MLRLWSRRRGAARRREPARAFAFESLEGRVVPATITVLNANDSGPDSLRAAIDQANAMPGPDTIAFAPSVTGTITLSSALPNLSTYITVDGPGASVLTVSRSAAPGTPEFGIFTVTAGAEVTISGLTITNGQAGPGFGGGISNAGTLTVTNSTLSGNSAADGAGIFNGGTLTVTNSTLSGNSAFVGGGGIGNAGTLTVTNSTLSGNSAFAGGGIFIFNTGSVTVTTVTNSTLSGNSAIGSGVSIFTGGVGGGIAINGGTLTVTNSTFSGNSALVRGSTSPGEGGGIFNTSGSVTGTVTVTTSIFANPTGGNLVSEAGTVFISLGHNLFSDVPGVALDSTDLLNVDPLLGPLADNGGPSFTQALLPGSPAIGAGAPVAGVTTDQRGIPRPQGGAPDIGAFESRGFTIAVVQGDSQRASAGSAFPEPLVVRVASPFGEPVTGGQVTFAVPPNGASAALSSNLATIDANGQAAVTATANGIGGTYAVTARATGAAGSVAFTLNNLTPTVVNLQRFGFHFRPTSLVLTFSQPMDPNRAETLSNYTLVALGHGHGRAIPLKAARYNSAARAVTLFPSQLLSLHRVYQITVNGMAPLGLTNTSGVLLDGRGNGQPGTNFVAQIDRGVVVLPPVQPGKGAFWPHRGSGSNRAKTTVACWAQCRR